jgi:hypothetical protein
MVVGAAYAASIRRPVFQRPLATSNGNGSRP